MTEVIVADSTCIIGLENINRLDILQAAFSAVIVPPAVSREIKMQVD